MEKHSENDAAGPGKNIAPGMPGSNPTWAIAAKCGVGTALSDKSRLWFTLSRGIVTEVYHPSIDKAAIRDLGFVITDGKKFFSEEQYDCAVDTQTPEGGVPAYIVETICGRGRYRLRKEIFADPTCEVLLQRVRLTAMQGTLEDLRLFALLSPRLGDQGRGNSGWIASAHGRDLLLARQGKQALALACSAPWLGRSAGFVGQSDAWQDIRQHGVMTRHYDRADNGHIGLAGEIDLRACHGEFILALSLSDDPGAAAKTAAAALEASFDQKWNASVQEWRTWQSHLKELESGNEKANYTTAQRGRPDCSRPRITPSGGNASISLYRSGMMALRVYRSKKVAGAGVASLSAPWGEARGDDDLGGYHLVWSRDLVESTIGLLAGGALEEAAATLNYLCTTQKPSGGWPKNMWLDGRAYSQGEQLDEAALPVLLLGLAQREGAVGEHMLSSFWPMVRKAAAYIIRSGPATGQDRWENAGGLSPYTLATEISALLVAARLADTFDDPKAGQYFRQMADAWNDQIELWTYVSDTPLARRVGVSGYYVLIAPSPGLDALMRRGKPPLLRQARDLPVTEVVSPDALALVRFGLRAADDPRILNTVKVIDALTRVELPAGPGWRRYNNGYYGEREDGSSPSAGMDPAGHGRVWPLLSGERGHYELARGNGDEARKMLHAMGGFASQAGFLPEQVWDSPDIPQRDLYRGRPSGSAMPLAWAHAEYIRLLRSIHDGAVFDLPADAWRRYVKGAHKSDLALWRFDHQADVFANGRRVRIELLGPAMVHFSADGWRTIRDIETRDTGLGFYFADLPTEHMKQGAELSFTFRWPGAGNRWEGRDFKMSVEGSATPENTAPPPPSRNSAPARAAGSLR